jgi:O-methyltransferase
VTTTDWILGSVAPIRRRLKRSRVGKALAHADVRALFPEATTAEIEILLGVKPYTMTSWERLWAVVQAVRYVHGRGIAGDFVECGVWRGGSSMAAAMALALAGDTGRTLHLFDTFAGMNRPTDDDRVVSSGEQAMDKWMKTRTADDSSTWCQASMEDVLVNLARTSYPPERIRLIQGQVEHTLRVEAHLPDRIAILRLDTDWYESTKVELEMLFARVTTGGVVIFDDYGHWAGAKKAIDEFLAMQPSYFLNRIDETGRLLLRM